MKTAVFTLELESEGELPEDFVDDLGSFINDGLEYYFDEYGSPVDVTVKFYLKGKNLIGHEIPILFH